MSYVSKQGYREYGVSSNSPPISFGGENFILTRVGVGGLKIPYFLVFYLSFGICLSQRLSSHFGWLEIRDYHSFTNLKIRDPNLRFVYFLEMCFRFEIRDSVIDEDRFESRFEIRSARMEIRFEHKIRCRNYFCQDLDSTNLKSTNLKFRKNRKSLGLS